MTSCDRFRDLVSDLVERRLEGEDLALASRHAMACRECRCVRDGVAALVRDLPLLAREPPEGLARRVVACVPCPRPRSLTPGVRASTFALRRVAGWAAVFVAAGWLAFAPSVSAWASGPGSEAVASARSVAERIDVGAGARRISAAVGAAGTKLGRAAFGPTEPGGGERPTSAPQAPASRAPQAPVRRTQ